MAPPQTNSIQLSHSTNQLSALWPTVYISCACSPLPPSSLSLAIRRGRDAGGSDSAQGEARVVPPNADKAGDEGLSGVDLTSGQQSTRAAAGGGGTSNVEIVARAVFACVRG